MRLIPIECVRENTYLAKTIYDDNGFPLLKEGALLTTPIINKLQDLYIRYIYIFDKYSTEEIEDIIKPELKQKSILLVKNSFKNIEQLYHSMNSKDQNSLDNDSLLKKQDDYIMEIQNVAEELLDNILSNDNVLVNLVDIKSMDNYTYQHCINVAILSVVIGLGMKLSRQDLLNLSLGAILHDVGKIFIPKTVLLKNGPLSNEEYLVMKKHPERGYNYLSNSSCISSNAKMIILQHHERYDGLGYPNALNGDKINRLAKIVSVADVYDSLTSDRPYRKALSPNYAFEYIIGNVYSMFDHNVVQAFSKVVVPYPEGSLVKLSNGDIGIVEDTLPECPLRPNIRIIRSEHKEKEGALIELANNLSLVISNIEYNV